MLVFIIPLRSKASSRSWVRVSLLFERTLRSVCAQTSPFFKVIVVCHEKPTICFNHPNVEYVEVNFPPPDEFSTQTGETDKGRKVLAGLERAKRLAPCHIMIVDADDCVSKHLAEYVDNNKDAAGWYIKQGYKYKDGARVIYKKNNFFLACGTCNIIRSELIPIPDYSEYNRGYGYYKFYINQEKIKEKLVRDRIALKPLPFLGAIYIVGHGENIYYKPGSLNIGPINFYVRPLTHKIREEYGIYDINQDQCD